MPEKHIPYILGLDLGTTSVGWAAVTIEDNDTNKPCDILKMGVRRFDAGVSGDIANGRDQSKATERREKRGPRRQTWRKQFRVRQVFRALQKHGMLPATESTDHDARHNLISELDNEIREVRGTGSDRVENHTLVYQLRREALDQEMPLFHFGRALFHLGHRRGFLSNRKTASDENETGVVKTGISELSAAMEDAGARTIGEYFASLDPEEYQIRKRWTARSMFLDEFNTIWNSQTSYHESMSDEARKDIYNAIFDQRPLKSQKMLIGKCSLEPQKRRAPLACLEVQRFRLLQKLNDLVIIDPALNKRPLEENERLLLADALEMNPKVTFAQMRKLLNINKKSKEYQRGFTFNFEEGGDKDLIGNRTVSKLLPIFDELWNALADDEKRELVNEIISFESEDALAQRLKTGWNIPAKTAIQVADTLLEQGYANHSRKAISNLLPLMEKGVSYATAVKQLYGDQTTDIAEMEFLPPYVEFNKELRNPAVERALSELRKVTNAIVRQYGKPAMIRVELARDLKNARKVRKDIQTRNKDNQKFRENASKKILTEIGERYVSRTNILKVQLAEECNWECPYTGRGISMAELVGEHPQFEIEHIIPFSRCLDNSFINKTLCHHEENRRKGNKTPFETYDGTSDYEIILNRVRRFRGLAGRKKLERFNTEKLPDAGEFVSRQLNDTRYICKAAAEYLGLYFGGQIVDGKQKIQVSPGRVTAYLRQRWELNDLIGHSDDKDRSDHRHHSIDALVVALTSPHTVRLLSKSAERMGYAGGSLFAAVEQPWTDFKPTVGEEVANIIVSSRVNRKLNGPLHKETILSHPRITLDKKGKEIATHFVRKALASMSKKDVNNIVDKSIREVVQQQLDRLGGTPDKAFKDSTDLPYVTTGDGRINVIKKARVQMPVHPMAVGEGSKTRYVNPGSNHHMEIVAVLDENGNETKWEGILVSRFEAIQRHNRGEPIIQTNHLPERRFIFSLSSGEHVMMDDRHGNQQIFRVTTVTNGRMRLLENSDARTQAEQGKSKETQKRPAPLTPTPNTFSKHNPSKVSISPLGVVTPAND
jgi:CRISPR-associated endonuclease Csn1